MIVIRQTETICVVGWMWAGCSATWSLLYSAASVPDEVGRASKRLKGDVTLPTSFIWMGENSPFISKSEIKCILFTIKPFFAFCASLKTQLHLKNPPGLVQVPYREARKVIWITLAHAGFSFDTVASILMWGWKKEDSINQTATFYSSGAFSLLRLFLGKFNAVERRKQWKSLRPLAKNIPA